MTVAWSNITAYVWHAFQELQEVIVSNDNGSRGDSGSVSSLFFI